MIDTYKWLPDCLVLSTASVNRIVNDVNGSSKKGEIINLIEGIKVDWRESVMGFNRAISDNEIIQCLESSIAPKMI